MRLYRTAAALPSPPAPRVVTVGVFDGLHLGHEAIVERATAEAKAAAQGALVFSFEPTPKEFFAPTNPPPRLTRFRERFERLHGLGVDELFCPSFGAVRDLDAARFIDELLVARLGARHVVVGDDFRFGDGQSGQHGNGGCTWWRDRSKPR